MTIINDDSRQLQDATNWDLTYLDFNADLSINNADEFAIDFEMGKDRVVETQLLTYNCEGNITGIDITESYNRKDKNETHELLTVGYSIDKSMITTSNIWNRNVSTALDQLKFCQVTQLVNPANESQPIPKFVIKEIKTQLVVDVDLSVDFTLDQELTVPTPKLVMTIPGNLTLSDVDPATSEENITLIETIFAQAIEEVTTGGLGEGQSVANVTVFGLRFEPNIHIAFELVLEEDCANTNACEELVSTTTMYGNVTQHIKNQIADGNFTLTLESIAIENAGRYLVEYGDTSRDSPHRKLVVSTMPNATGYENGTAIINILELTSTVGTGSGEADLISYVAACKCDGAQSFTCNTDNLVPNTELSVCIRSVSTDVEIDFIDSMTVSQTGSQDMDIIDNSTILSPRITSWTYVSGSNEVAVSTRVPVNLFEFGEGKSITISGEVVVKLAGGNRRKLQVVTSDAPFDENSYYQLKVGVLDNSGPPVKVLNNSADTGTHKGFVVLGMIFSLFFAMFW